MNQTEQSQVFPASITSITSSSEQYQAHQCDSDDWAQRDLSVAHELNRLDRCKVEYALYKKGQCTVGPDGFVYDSEGLMLSRTESDIKRAVSSPAIADGYVMSPSGSITTDYGKPKEVFKKVLLPSAKLSAEKDEEAGVRYTYLNSAKHQCYIDVHYTEVYDNYSGLRTKLSHAGIQCPGYRGDALLSYLHACCEMPGLNVIYQRPQAGFCGELPAYLWPGNTICKEGWNGPQCELLPDLESDPDSNVDENLAIRPNGSLDE